MKPYFISAIITACAICGACKQETKTPQKETIVSSPRSNVSIELSFPSYVRDKFLFFPCENNEVSIIVRNNTDTAIHFCTLDNSMGYRTFSFIIRSKDSTYLVKKAETAFWKNIPFSYLINPNESLVFNFNIKNTKCSLKFSENGQLTRKIIRGTAGGWDGLPDRSIEDATIQAVYKISDEYFDFKPFGDSIFSDSLVSNSVKVHIEKKD